MVNVLPATTSIYRSFHRRKFLGYTDNNDRKQSHAWAEAPCLDGQYSVNLHAKPNGGLDDARGKHEEAIMT